MSELEGLLEALHTAAVQQGFAIVYVADAEAVSEGDIRLDLSRSIIVQHDGSVVCIPQDVAWELDGPRTRTGVWRPTFGGCPEPGPRDIDDDGRDQGFASAPAWAAERRAW